jgi:hypothetical protein
MPGVAQTQPPSSEQVALQPSPLVTLWSSQPSPLFTWPSPQAAVGVGVQGMPGMVQA